MPGGRRWEQEKGGLVKDEAEEWSVECETWLLCFVNPFNFHQQMDRCLLWV